MRGTGNALANRLVDHHGATRLSGEAGNDSLPAGAGHDGLHGGAGRRHRGRLAPPRVPW